MREDRDLMFMKRGVKIKRLSRGLIPLLLTIGALPVVAQQENDISTEEARIGLWDQAWAVRRGGESDSGYFTESVPPDLRPATSSAYSDWAATINSQCTNASTLKQRERCGRWQLISADANTARAVTLQSMDSLSEPQARNVTSAATHLIDFLNGHAGGLTTYKENYFTLRPNPIEAKFQVSFKYKLFVDTRHPVTGNGMTGKWWRDKLLSNSYFSYTQNSFWDLDAPSGPFSDINFNPQLFLFYPKNDKVAGLTGYWFGAEHESNGRDGPDSRSWDRLFVKAELSYGAIVITPKIWHILSKADENSDIEDFAGYAEASARYELPNGTRLSMIGRRGMKKGGGEVAYSFRWRTLIPEGSALARFDPWIHLRYWTGYGENLLNYNQKSSSFRIGFALALPPVFPERSQ